MRQKKAFSLFELSISLAIIGIVIAALSQGVKLINSSKLTAAKALTSSSPVKKIPGLIAWYETSLPESILTNEEKDEASINTWFDVSPNSIPEKKNRLTRIASSAVTFENEGIGGIPSIEFNGTGMLNLANFYQGNSAQNTIFFVARPYLIGPGVVVIDSGPSATQNSTITLNSAGIYAYWGSNSQINDSGCCSINKDYIVAFYANRSLSKAHINSASNIAGGSLINPGNGSLIGLTVGATYNNLSNFSGLISEVIIFNRPLNDSERNEIMRYLSKKFGVKLT